MAKAKKGQLSYKGKGKKWSAERRKKFEEKKTRPPYAPASYAETLPNMTSPGSTSLSSHIRRFRESKAPSPPPEAPSPPSSPIRKPAKSRPKAKRTRQKTFKEMTAKQRVEESNKYDKDSKTFKHAAPPLSCWQSYTKEGHIGKIANYKGKHEKGFRRKLNSECRPHYNFKKKGGQNSKYFHGGRGAHNQRKYIQSDKDGWPEFIDNPTETFSKGVNKPKGSGNLKLQRVGFNKNEKMIRISYGKSDPNRRITNAELARNRKLAKRKKKK